MGQKTTFFKVRKGPLFSARPCKFGTAMDTKQLLRGIIKAKRAALTNFEKVIKKLHFSKFVKGPSLLQDPAGSARPRTQSSSCAGSLKQKGWPLRTLKNDSKKLHLSKFVRGPSLLQHPAATTTDHDHDYDDSDDNGAPAVGSRPPFGDKLRPQGFACILRSLPFWIKP